MKLSVCLRAFLRGTDTSISVLAVVYRVFDMTVFAFDFLLVIWGFRGGSVHCAWVIVILPLVFVCTHAVRAAFRHPLPK